MSNICSKCDKDFSAQANTAVLVLPENHGWPINTGKKDPETGADLWKIIRCADASSEQVSVYRASVLALKSKNIAANSGAAQFPGFSKVEGDKKD